MKIVRKHVFEANSSSCHSITFDFIPAEVTVPSIIDFCAKTSYCSEGPLTTPLEKADYF